MNTPTDAEDDQSGMMGWWTGDALDTPFFLKTRMAFGVVIGLAATLLFTYIILQMERQTTTYNAALMESAVGERDTQLELEEDTQSTMTNGTAHQSNSDYVQASDDHGNDDMSIHSSATNNTRNGRSNSPKSVIAAISNKADGLFKPGDTRRRLLSTSQHVQVIVHVMIVILFIYLLLVFLPGSIWLSFFAVMIVWVLALQSYLQDEIKRRRRFDRIATLLGLFSIIAGSLALITYCHMSLKEGNIYEGPARIVGYDDTSYTNTDGSTMRADLVVSWGGMWGCPDIGGKQCTATVQGALCETEYEANPETGGDGRRRRSRRVETSAVVEKVEQYQEEEEERDEEEEVTTTEAPIVTALEEEVDEESEEIEELSEELDTETEVHIEGEDALEEEVTVLESNSTDAETEEGLTDVALTEAYEAGATEGEVEVLENENEELQNELDEAKETIEELDEEVEDIEVSYVYDDTIYEDTYWQETDWDSIWGEYACEDLFDSDVEQGDLDVNVAPGKDHWPTVNIYGSCNSCEAYILDYYSTEHYQNIRQFENQSYLYYVAGFFCMVGAAILAILERKRPNRENKIVLLSQERGVAA